MRKISFIITILFSCSTALLADDRVIAERVNLSFEPTKAVLLIWSEAQLIKTEQAEIIKADALREIDQSNQKFWYIAGTFAEVPGVPGVTTLFYIEGEKEYFITPQQYIIMNNHDNDSYNLSKHTDKLAFETWNIQNEARQTDSALRKLKEEIGVVGELDQIVKLRQEQKRYQALLESVRQEEAALKASMMVLKAAVKPVQYARREIELMRANSELTTKTIPYAGELRKIERQRKKYISELLKLEKKFSKIDISSLEAKLRNLKEKSEGRPF